tara:strand:- start:1233 stop:2378 length:1146 start_codon:yes stop_codon:yes gene_type:complete
MTNKINFTDVDPIQAKNISIIKNNINKIILKKDFILGKSVKIFEKNFSKLSNIKYSVGCASGTDALILALKSLNLKKNDEVIVPALTYISTGLSVLLNNNKLIYADVDENTGLISIENVLKKISKNTKVVIAVNLYGQKVNLKKLRKFIGKRVFIIEDSAQSHLAYSCYNCTRRKINFCCKKERNDKYADISCYSFYPSKNLGAYGDGGLVSTNYEKIYKNLLSLRNLGSIKKNVHNLLGINSRLDSIQAAVLNEKLKSILKINQQRRKLANIYDEQLKKIRFIKTTMTNPGSSRHLYVVRTKQRNSLIKYLLKYKIYCQIHYPYTLNKLKPFLNRTRNKELVRNSEKWARECLSLPLHSNMSITQVYRITNKIKKYFIKK